MTDITSKITPESSMGTFRSLTAPILCGTDFSPNATEAIDAGAMLARRLGEKLVLVHAVDPRLNNPLPHDLSDSLCVYERAQLHEERERLRAAEAEVIEEFKLGSPEQILLEEAEVHHARLIVLSSQGRRSSNGWMLGSVTETVAETAHIPTLVVRSAAPLIQWMNGKKRLRVFVGADFSKESEAAMSWVGWLNQIAPCNIVVACLEPVILGYEPLDYLASNLTTELIARTEEVQERAFRQRARVILGSKSVRVRIEKGWGRSDAHLIQMAREEQADLLVVGTHQRQGLKRFGHVSVSRGVLHYAPINVACVPVASRTSEETANANQDIP